MCILISLSYSNRLSDYEYPSLILKNLSTFFKPQLQWLIVFAQCQWPALFGPSKVAQHIGMYWPTVILELSPKVETRWVRVFLWSWEFFERVSSGRLTNLACVQVISQVAILAPCGVCYTLTAKKETFTLSHSRKKEDFMSLNKVSKYLSCLNSQLRKLQ